MILKNKISLFYKEGRIEREVSWAGQGLQVWFQIVTHLVRLRNCSILVLDEPEINLHPEKQNELIRILKDYFKGSTIIATHSVELMNNVNVSHIIYVQKMKTKPQIKSTKDRTYLEIVRSQIGSNFNLIASQFDNFDLILFTEDSSDFVTIDKLAHAFGINKNVFNIPIHGFCEYPKAVSYKKAYEIMIGNTAKYSMLLDRDHYPEEHLKYVKEQLENSGIRLIFTHGKEIENLFLSPEIINILIPKEIRNKFNEFWIKLFEDERLDCYGSFLSLHEKFLPKKLDTKTITKNYTPIFDNYWSKEETRYQIINGKQTIKKLKNFYRNELQSNLSQEMLIEAAKKSRDKNILNLLKKLYYQ